MGGEGDHGGGVVQAVLLLAVLSGELSFQGQSVGWLLDVDVHLSEKTHVYILNMCICQRRHLYIS